MPTNDSIASRTFSTCNNEKKDEYCIYNSFHFRLLFIKQQFLYMVTSIHIVSIMGRMSRSPGGVSVSIRFAGPRKRRSRITGASAPLGRRREASAQRRGSRAALWRVAVPGRSSGFPPLPPQTRTCPIKASGSSVTTGLSPWLTKQVTPRLAHNFCCPLARSDVAVDDPGFRKRIHFPVKS
jgi:hypothetical protein